MQESDMVVLSFDLEEFDLPLEYGEDLTFEEQIAVSDEGLEQILSILDKCGIPATFYSTVLFFDAISPHLRSKLSTPFYELASHSMEHSAFALADLKESKTKLENLCGNSVIGFRMLRMMNVEMSALKEGGYLYDSSLNPTWIPGRYDNRNQPSKTYYTKEGILELLGPVTSLLRIPLFGLGLHHYPFGLYKYLVAHSARKQGYLQLYFHPWEFASWDRPLLKKLPWIVRRNAGEEMCRRLESRISYFQKKEIPFTAAQTFLDTQHRRGQYNLS